MKLRPLSFRHLAFAVLLTGLFAGSAMLLLSISSNEPANAKPLQLTKPAAAPKLHSRILQSSAAPTPAALDSTAEQIARHLAAQPVTEQNRHAFCAAMSEWAAAAPIAALAWWHDEAQDAAQSAGLEVDENFYATSFTALAKQDLTAAVASARAADRAESRLVALGALARTAAALGRLPWLMDNPPADSEWTPAERVVLLLAVGAAEEAHRIAATLPEGHESAWLASQLSKPDDIGDDDTTSTTTAP